MKIRQDGESNDSAPTAERFSSIFFVSLFLIVNWCISAVVLWWAYAISSVIRGGAYGRNDALRYVLEMGLIMTVLTAIAWVAAKKHQRGWKPDSLFWDVVWKTAAVQTAYMLVVVVRRELWTPKQGMSDGSMFLPIVGNVNAEFFSEFGWISFLLQVVPIAALVSAVLYHLQARISRKIAPIETLGLNRN
jgi:hypothetical protein